MKIVSDYEYWLVEKKHFLEKMEKADSLIYDRLMPFVVIVEYLSKKDSFDEDEAYIFSVGFNYLNEKVYELESYSSNQFSTFEELDENSVTYNFLCELEDFKMDFTDMSEEDEENVQEYIDQVEKLLLSRDIISDSLYQEIIELLNEIIENNGEYLPITEIFKQVGENYKIL
ncbi:hypothetical protein RI065_05085 [Mycoplasmatota bacterium zrk1]